MAVTAEPEFDPACGTYISWSGGLSLPETFGALIRDDDMPWDVRLEVFVEQDGIAKCTSLTIEVPEGTTIDEGWEPVTPSGFRRVRLSVHLEAACAAAAVTPHRARGKAMQLAEPDGDAPVPRPRPARPIRGRRTPDEFLRGVAHAYLEATKSTPSRGQTRPAVEDWYRDQYHAGVGKNVVETWIRWCRNRIDPKTGSTFLPKTEPRRVSR
jgi:hypothetical protein